jgi:hypothetical protein
MASVNHVVVDGDRHHGWIEDDAADDAGVHCRVRLLGGFPFLLKLLEYLGTFQSDKFRLLTCCFRHFIQTRQFVFLYLMNYWQLNQSTNTPKETETGTRRSVE